VTISASKSPGSSLPWSAWGSVPQGITVKCTPEKFAELTEREGIAPAAYVGRYKWVTLEHLDVLAEPELREAISQSYNMVAAKAKPRSKRATGGKQRARTAK
jgi:predicted DNA-binding protein (MmcQ/YjbR family)